MKKVYQVFFIAVFLGVFAAPSFVSANTLNTKSIVTVNDEPTKKEATESDTKTAGTKETEKKSECTKSADKKAACDKDKAKCEKDKSSCTSK